MRLGLVIFNLVLLSTFCLAQADGAIDIDSNRISKKESFDRYRDIYQNYGASGLNQVVDNLSTVTGERTAKLIFHINNHWKGAFDSVYVRYTELVEARSKSPDWVVVGPVHVDSTQVEVRGLKEQTDYIFQLGIPPRNASEGVWWSYGHIFNTRMGWGVWRWLMLLGALAVVILGLRLFGNSLAAVLDVNMLDHMGKFARTGRAFRVGFTSTAILQSSSLVTRRLVRAASAGVISLPSAMAAMMGSNVGTTISAWLFAVLGFSLALGDYALILIAAVFPLFFGQGKFRTVGLVVVGFAVMFLGLEYLNQVVPDLRYEFQTVRFLRNMSGTEGYNVLIAVMIGALITLFVQSSSASLALTMALTYQGIIPFELAAGMVGGQNIGTTASANLVALRGGPKGRGVAMAHLWFNIFGAIWLVLFFPEFTRATDEFLGLTAHQASAFDKPAAAPIGLAMFHTGLNLVSTLILIWFVKPMSRLFYLRSSRLWRREHKAYLGERSQAVADSEEQLNKLVGLNIKLANRMNSWLARPVRELEIVTSLISESIWRWGILANQISQSSVPYRGEVDLKEALTKLGVHMEGNRRLAELMCQVPSTAQNEVNEVRLSMKDFHSRLESVQHALKSGNPERIVKDNHEVFHLRSIDLNHGIWAQQVNDVLRGMDKNLSSFEDHMAKFLEIETV